MKEELKEEYYRKTPGYPSEERIKGGPVAIIECAQEIPCNPCETSCSFGAIKVSYPITNLPVLEGDKCKGCGKCIAICPGLAIFLLNLNYSEGESSLTISYEILALPEKGEIVICLDREGREICDGKVIRVIPPEKNERTALVTFSFSKEFYREVRNIRLNK